MNCGDWMSCGPINSSRPRTKESPPQNIPLLIFAVLFMMFMLAVTMMFPRMAQALIKSRQFFRIRTDYKVEFGYDAPEV